MPNLRDPRQCENAQRQIRNNLQRDRRHEQLFPIKRVGYRAGEKAENNKWQGFQKTREA